jgi:hypothetical protein
MEQTLFHDWKITLNSEKLDRPIIGSAFFFNNAKINLERELLRTARQELRKLISVYKHSKYEFNPIEGPVTLEKLEQLLTSFNSRTKLVRLQKLLQANAEVLELALPIESARTYPSQQRKIDFLMDLILLDLDTIHPPKPEQISQPKSTDHDHQ